MFGFDKHFLFAQFFHIDSSHYDSIDNLGTRVQMESVALQVDRPSLSEHQDKSMDFINTKSLTPPADQQMISLQDLGTGYAPLGDRSTPPPPTVYDRLHVQQPTEQETSSPSSENTSDKTSSTPRDVAVKQDPDNEPYVNVNQINFVGKVSEIHVYM